MVYTGSDKLKKIFSSYYSKAHAVNRGLEEMVLIIPCHFSRIIWIPMDTKKWIPFKASNVQAYKILALTIKHFVFFYALSKRMTVMNFNIYPFKNSWNHSVKKKIGGFSLQKCAS